MRLVTALIAGTFAVCLLAPGAIAQRTTISMPTATPGGGFPLFGDNAAVINEANSSLQVETKNTRGSDMIHPGVRK